MDLRFLEVNGEKRLQIWKPSEFDGKICLNVGYFVDVPTVEEEKKVWCEHLINKFSNKAQRERWFFYQPSKQYGECVADDFKLCPICGAPRPKE